MCKAKYGACVRCSNGTCKTSFHPMCAREARHRMEIWGKFGCDNLELRAFCLKHSKVQDVSSTQQLGDFFFFFFFLQLLVATFHVTHQWHQLTNHTSWRLLSEMEIKLLVMWKHLITIPIEWWWISRNKIAKYQIKCWVCIRLYWCTETHWYAYARVN